MGQKFKQLESIGELETLKISIDLISPFSGECIAVCITFISNLYFYFLINFFSNNIID